jgi:penicillin-binding protein 1A
VGFNDQRVTMRSEYWGQGGHNAVLLVGDFFKEALKGRLIDTGVAFPPPRRPPVITTYAPPPDEVTETAISAGDIAVGDEAIAAARNGATPITRTNTSGTTTYGDSAGVEALRHSTTPPKSAEELEQAFGRDGSRRASGNLGDVLPDSRAAPAPPPPPSAPQRPPDTPAGEQPLVTVPAPPSAAAAPAPMPTPQ